MPLFEAIVRQACEACGAPAGMIVLWHDGQPRREAVVGPAALHDAAIGPVWCAQTLAQGGLFEIVDAAPGLRFFAGVPLRLDTGQALGTLCVLGTQAYRLDPDQARALEGLARIAGHALDLRARLDEQLMAARSRFEHDLAAAEGVLRELTTIFDSTTDFVVQTDGRGQVLYMNPSARQAVGLAPDAPLDTFHYADFNTEATNRLYAQTIVPAVRSGKVWVGETTINLAGRPAVPMSHMVLAHVDALGRVTRYSSVMRDISAAVEAQQEIVHQAEVLRSVTEAIPATVVVVGADGRYRFVNGAFERYCGLPRERILGRTASEVLGADEVARRRPWMQRAMAGEAVHFTLDYATPDGGTHLALSCIPLRLPSGGFDGFVGVSQDITHQKLEERRLTQLAQRDPLTGLLNRAGFEQGISLLQLQPGHHGLAVLYIDLDNFKPVNDRHGHPAGDRVLEQFAQRLAAAVRPTDVVARLGGDEFAVALGGMREAAHVAAVADKVLAAAHAPFVVGPLSLTVGATVGVAFGDDSTLPWRDLLDLADTRLLQAKAAGKGRQLGASPQTALTGY